MTDNEKILMYVIKRHEEKLKQYMSEQEFVEFSTEVAKEMFNLRIQFLPESDFKDFCLENFDKIVGDEE